MLQPLSLDEIIEMRRSNAGALKPGAHYPGRSHRNPRGKDFRPSYARPEVVFDARQRLKEKRQERMQDARQKLNQLRQNKRDAQRLAERPTIRNDLNNNQIEGDLRQQSDLSTFVNKFKIVISNIPFDWTEEDIKEFSEVIGEVLETRLVQPGKGEVIYNKLEAANTAVSKFHNRRMYGQQMECILVKPRDRY